MTLQQPIDLGPFALDRTGSSAPASAAPLALGAGDLVGKRYRLVRRIAHGFVSTVWCGHDERLGRDVAIKLLDADLCDDEDSRRRFVREARSAGAVESEHVVEILDVGVERERPYIVMELLVGEDLGSRLDRESQLPLAACQRLLTQLAPALDEAHRRGIVHRDIKPKNLFFARAVVDGRLAETIKLLDFGVAKLRRDTSVRTKTGMLVASPHFSSPEQVRGVRDLDGRSDLFALAAVLYRCVTGELPFDGGDFVKTAMAVAKGDFAPPSRVRKGLSPAMDAFFKQALASDRDLRFATATEMAEAFESALTHKGPLPDAEEILVRPVARPDQRIERAVRVRAMANVALVGVALLGFATALASVLVE